MDPKKTNALLESVKSRLSGRSRPVKEDLDADLTNWEGRVAKMVKELRANKGKLGSMISVTPVDAAIRALEELHDELTSTPGNRPRKSKSLGEATGHDAKDTYDFLDRARVEMFDGKAAHSLTQVARFSDVPEAKAFAKRLSNQLYAMSQQIASYLHNNRDLTKPAPK